MELGLSQQKFAEKLGYKTRAPIKDMETGVTCIRPSIAKNIQGVFGIQAKWLLEGQGPIMGRGKIDYEEFKEHVITAITMVEELLAEKDIALSIAKKAEVIVIVLDQLIRRNIQENEAEEILMPFIKLAS